MREDYWIFVEGVADKRFLEQLIEYHWGKVKKGEYCGHRRIYEPTVWQYIFEPDEKKFG